MRRFLIGAVAAAAVFASAPAPAQAHHDEVCVPAVPGPVCVRGLQHVVPETQAAAWDEFVGLMMPLVDAYVAGSSNLEAVPDEVCASTLSPVCVTGLRGLAYAAYWGGGFAIFTPPFTAACYALGRPECPLPTPPGA